MGRLAPSIAKDKNIISRNSQHNEDRELDQRVIERNLEDAAVDKVRDGEWKDNHEYGHWRHKETLKVEPDEAKDEEQASDCIREVTLKKLFEVDIHK